MKIILPNKQEVDYNIKGKIVAAKCFRHLYSGAIEIYQFSSNPLEFLMWLEEINKNNYHSVNAETVSYP